MVFLLKLEYHVKLFRKNPREIFGKLPWAKKFRAQNLKKFQNQKKKRRKEEEKKMKSTFLPNLHLF